MSPELTAATGREALRRQYAETLLDDVIPFWLRHGLDREHGGILTCLDRDGTVIDTDKAVWFQGRAGWMFSTLYNTVERRTEWLEAARSCVEFSRRHCFAPDGKMYFLVTREGRPLRMRRYVYSEAFAAMALAAFARAAGDSRAAEESGAVFSTYLRHSFTPGVMPPKYEATRPMRALGPYLIAVGTAQEVRANLGDIVVGGRSCTEWIRFGIAEIERLFLKPESGVLLEVAGPAGEILDHHDGRTLNPGHALECAAFILREAALSGDRRLVQLGCSIVDWMWDRGWDSEYGGLFYYRDLRGLPVQEYWHDMKFWWPQTEGILASLWAWNLTQDAKYAGWHRLIHEWSFRHFPDPTYGEWYGYLHRDGRVSSRAKGTFYKGPFHLPRMLWQAAWLLGENESLRGR